MQTDLLQDEKGTQTEYIEVNIQQKKDVLNYFDIFLTFITTNVIGLFGVIYSNINWENIENNPLFTQVPENPNIVQYEFTENYPQFPENFILF